ncbi:hypothetical protein ONZ45_g10304 [Pleurotus djamor]|nr:hypothetical protein ONZ45_g10304 [Pleurotus djamor]
MSTSTIEGPAQENISIQVTDKPSSKKLSTGPPPTESPSRRALLPTQVGVATDENHNNSTVASAAAKAQVDPAAADEKKEDDAGGKKTNAPTKKSARIAQSKKKNQVEEKSKELTLPEGSRIIYQGYGRLFLPTDSVNAENASVASANDAVVDDVKEVVTTGAKNKKTHARRKSTANLRVSSSKDNVGATQPPARVVKKAGRGKAKAIVDNDVDAAEPSTKTKKATSKKTVVDPDAPAEPKPKVTKGKKAATKKVVVPSISVRAAVVGKGKGKAKEIKLSRFAPVAEGSNAVKRKAPEDDEEADEDRNAGDEDDARRPSKRAKLVT